MNTHIEWAKDPQVKVIVLKSWDPELKKLLADYAALYGWSLTDEGKEYVHNAPPPGWSVNINVRFGLTLNDSVIVGGGPGQPVDLTFTVNMPTAGKALFAVKVVEEGAPQNFVISDIIGIDRR